MIDNDMTSILKNFASAGTGEVTDAATGEAKVNPAAVEKNAMKSLLEGLDAQQTSVNQMPGTHTMAKNGAKHPASKYLVGGEFDEETELDEADQVTSGSIFAKLRQAFPDDSIEKKREWARSAAEYGQPLTVEEYAEWRKYDEQGNIKDTNEGDDQIYNKYKKHIGPNKGTTSANLVKSAGKFYPNVEILTDKLHQIHKARGLESTKDTNEDTIAKRKTGSDVHKKQSFADIFRSMDETEDDMATRFKKELHDEKSEKALNKGDNGKFDLAERFHDGEELSWGDEMLEDLKLLLHDAESYEDLRNGILSTIQQYEA